MLETITITISITIVEVESRDEFSHNGFRNTPVGSSRAYVSVCLSICIYISLSNSLSGRPCHIIPIKVFAQRMRPYATG